MEVLLWETYLLDADAAVEDTTTQETVLTAVLLFGFYFCSAFSAAETVWAAASADADAMMDVTTTVCG